MRSAASSNLACRLRTPAAAGRSAVCPTQGRCPGRADPERQTRQPADQRAPAEARRTGPGPGPQPGWQRRASWPHRLRRGRQQEGAPLRRLGAFGRFPAAQARAPQHQGVPSSPASPFRTIRAAHHSPGLRAPPTARNNRDRPVWSSTSQVVGRRGPRRGRVRRPAPRGPSPSPTLRPTGPAGPRWVWCPRKAASSRSSPAARPAPPSAATCQRAAIPASPSAPSGAPRARGASASPPGGRPPGPPPPARRAPLSCGPQAARGLRGLPPGSAHPRRPRTGPPRSPSASLSRRTRRAHRLPWAPPPLRRQAGRSHRAAPRLPPPAGTSHSGCPRATSSHRPRRRPERRAPPAAPGPSINLRRILPVLGRAPQRRAGAARPPRPATAPAMTTVIALPFAVRAHRISDRSAAPARSKADPAAAQRSAGTVTATPPGPAPGRAPRLDAPLSTGPAQVQHRREPGAQLAVQGVPVEAGSRTEKFFRRAGTSAAVLAWTVPRPPSWPVLSGDRSAASGPRPRRRPAGRWHPQLPAPGPGHAPAPSWLGGRASRKRTTCG